MKTKSRKARQALQPTRYRGFLIEKDFSARHVVMMSNGDGFPIVIADKFQTLSLAKEWVDQTQF